MIRIAVAIAIWLAGALALPLAAGTQEPEAVSLLGQPLYPREISTETRARLEANLADAQAAYDAAPIDPDAIIWLGRRLGYLERYHEAVDVFSEGIALHPEDARMYRHRGHRYITLREFDRAVTDLAHAAELIRGTPDEVEPDGAPNAYGIPTSTLQSNIWYHLGLAHYLRGDWEAAAEAYHEALDVSTSDDMLVATADWLYMTLRRMGADGAAAAVLELVRPDMRILENHAYHRRLMMYRGELAPGSLLDETADELTLATQGYGLGSWYLYSGRPDRAMGVFRRVVAGPYWAAFGYIAAEAELAR